MGIRSICAPRLVGWMILGTWLAVPTPLLFALPRHAELRLAPADADLAGLVPRADAGLALADKAAQGQASWVLRGLPAAACRLAVELVGAHGRWDIEVACLPGRWQPLAGGSDECTCRGDVSPRLRLSTAAHGGSRPRLDEVRVRLDWTLRAPRPAPRFAPGPVRAPMPAVVGRREWGALGPKDRYEPHQPVALVVHHSYIPDIASYLARGGAESVAGIQRFHMFDAERLWSDVGYHFLIGPDGNLFAGRPPEAVGAHAVPNSGKVGICLIGNHDPGADPVSPAAWATLVELVAALAHRYDISLAETLHGHREFSPKSCPGDSVYQRFDELREAVWRRIGTMGEPSARSRIVGRAPKES